MSRERKEQPPFAALVERRGRFVACTALFERGPQLQIVRGANTVSNGQIALVAQVRDGVRVLRPLGDAKVARDVVEALVYDSLDRRGFGERIESDARLAARSAAEEELPRRDLTDLATFTVDPATARDFDDAVSASREGEAIRLWIHIADVAAHVRPGTALDGEAERRATSVYVPGMVEPMLPHVLSGDACSLAPGVERLAVTTEILLRSSGEVESVSFYRSRVRSDERLDYDQLDEIFAGRTEPPAEVATPLALARQAASLLAERRTASSLAVDSREPEFSFDDAGRVEAARGVAQTEAHRLIEQLMILTNEQVASMLERRRVPAIYRIHEQPDADRIGYLFDQLGALDVPTPSLPETLGPSGAGELAAKASHLVAEEARRRGHGREAYTMLILRSLKQARYSPENLGHAGLGSTAYAHFTSPIRRYPDLVCHRALLAMLGAGEVEPERSAVHEAAWWCSEREREAISLERRADRICIAFLLERELYSEGWDRELEGEVSGLARAGAFVRFEGELADVYEGFLPARDLPGERFDLDETETSHIGGRTGRRLRLGDPVKVRIGGVEAARGRVDLVPAGEWADAKGQGAPRGEARGRGGGGPGGSGGSRGAGNSGGSAGSSGGRRARKGPARRGAARGRRRR